MGIWSKSEIIYFRQQGPYGWICLEPTSDAFSINAISLDDYGSSILKDVEKLDFIKIDIEGSEVAALEGGANLFKRFNYPPIFVEANAWTLAVVNNRTTADLMRAAKALGYEVYRWNYNSWNKYDVTYFFDDVCTDYMLLHPSHDNSFVGKIGEEYPRQSEKQIIDSIAENLKNFLVLNKTDAILASEDAASTYQPSSQKRRMAKLAFERGIATLCNLREHPLLCQKQEIAGLLPYFIPIREKFPFLQKALSWYE